jgi:hypothetical protein
MEALQMLKFHLKKARLSFTHDWVTPEDEMLEDDPEEDLLGMLFQGRYQDGMDQIIRAMDADDLEEEPVLP